MPKLLFLLFSIISFASEASLCPYPDSAIDPQISVEITKDNLGSYIYSYTIKNSPKGILPLHFLRLQTKTKPDTVRHPENWNPWGQDLDSIKRDSYDVKFMSSPLEKGISPNETMSGFIIKSKNPPGMIMVRAEGKTFSMPRSNVPMVDETYCPGVWSYGSTGIEDSKLKEMVQGPLPENWIGIEAFMKEEKAPFESFKKQKLKLQHLDQRVVEILIEGSNNFNPEELLPATLLLGRGYAKPSKQFYNKDTKSLVLTYPLEQVKVACNIDRVLFIEGKLKDGKNFQAGIRIDVEECNQENLKKEIPKMLPFNEHRLKKRDGST